MVGQLFKIRLMALVAIAVSVLVAPGRARTPGGCRPRVHRRDRGSPRGAGGATDAGAVCISQPDLEPVGRRCAGAGLRGSLRCLRLLRRRRLPGDLARRLADRADSHSGQLQPCRPGARHRLRHLQRRGRLPGHDPVQRHCRDRVRRQRRHRVRAAVDVLSLCARLPTGCRWRRAWTTTRTASGGSAPRP